MTAETMWQAYAGQSGVDAPYEAWAFCGGGAAGDRLAELTLAGIKTATASAYIAYESENEPLPTTGCCSVILTDAGDAVCIIRTSRVRVVPFNEVDARHAYLEGESDRSLAYWQAVHREAFTPDYRAAGLEFQEDGLCVLEEFEVVYPQKAQARR
ncbi:MAG: ASCH domain-containing protein [Oscillospiraceae bacterium]|nr:ASCH domain-containing protein [Oscillospiraceae bacterium]